MTTVSVPTVDAVAPGLRTRVPAGAFAKTRMITLGVGVVSLLVSLLGWFFGDAEQFLFSYLASYMFVLSLALGALFFVLIQHLTRAGWSVVVRRIAENFMATIPLLVLLFVPIAIGYRQIFHGWVAPEPNDAVLAGKHAYLNPTFFFGRAAIYFAAWVVMTWWLRRTSLAQDETGDPGLTLKMARVSAPMMLVFAFSISYAAIDWVMSLSPHWSSTMWGVYYFAGSTLGFLALLSLAMMWVQGRGWLDRAISIEHYHDVGKLMFAFVVFWTYIAFSQYMLIWYANLPEETAWFHSHLTGSWGFVGNSLIVGHFALPFVFLLSRHVKRRRTSLAVGAVFILFMHWVDVHWMVMPTLHEAGVSLHWQDATTVLGIGGLFLWLFSRLTENAPLLPERDPRLRESLDFVNQ